MKRGQTSLPQEGTDSPFVVVVIDEVCTYPLKTSVIVAVNVLYGLVSSVVNSDETSCGRELPTRLKAVGFNGTPHDDSFLFQRTVHITKSFGSASLPSTGISSRSSYGTLGLNLN